MNDPTPATPLGGSPDTPVGSSTPGGSATAAPAPQLKLVLLAAFIAFLAQTTLNPVIAPLSREVHLHEWQIGLTISTAAVMVVLTSQIWGRRAQALGAKRVLIAAFAIALVTTVIFALVSWLGMRGTLTGTVLFIAFVLLRGVLFGAAIAAVQPTAQAFIASVTTDDASRVKGMAGVGAVQGLAQIAGAVVGGALAVFGLLVPIVAVPVLLLAGLALVAVAIPRQQPSALIATPAKVRPSDPRVWPFLLAGFGLFTSMGFMQVVAGFIVQDRLGTDAETTAAITGGAMLSAGVGMILAQGLIVPRSGWGPTTLLRVGAAVALAGFALLTPDLGIVALFASVVLIGVGIGTAMPGFTAGPTLLVSPEEQGGLAGVIAATMGLTYVVAPTAGTVLYSWWAPAPILFSVATLAAVCIFLLVHPRFRQLPEVPASEVTPPQAQ